MKGRSRRTTTSIRKAVSVLVTASTISLVSVSAAGAATQVGNDCVVSNGTGDIGALQLSKDPSSPLPITAPSAGVVTKWKLSLIPTEEKIQTRMVVFRSTAAPNQFLDVAESPPGIVHSGSNEFDVRIPVQAGDRFGNAGGSSTGGALFCTSTSTTDKIGFGLLPSVGSPMTIAEEAEEALVGMLVTIEPDADGDGYGDETQDLCPQSATTQAICPVAILDAFAIAGKSSITVLISSSTEVPVAVSATAGKAALKKVTRKAKPGTITRFKLKLTPRIKSDLADLAPGKKLTVKITAKATNVTGTVSKDSAKVKLKGTG